MVLKPLEVLKRGLEHLRNKVKAKRDHLLAQLADRKSISSLEEHWLDNDRNLVLEEHILDTLERASDYERGVERLGDEGKAVVIKLREFAGDLLPKASKKRKYTLFIISGPFKTEGTKYAEPKPKTYQAHTIPGSKLPLRRKMRH